MWQQLASLGLSLLLISRRRESVNERDTRSTGRCFMSSVLEVVAAACVACAFAAALATAADLEKETQTRNRRHERQTVVPRERAWPLRTWSADRRLEEGWRQSHRATNARAHARSEISPSSSVAGAPSGHSGSSHVLCVDSRLRSFVRSIGDACRLNGHKMKRREPVRVSCCSSKFCRWRSLFSNRAAI